MLLLFIVLLVLVLCTHSFNHLVPFSLFHYYAKYDHALWTFPITFPHVMTAL